MSKKCFLITPIGKENSETRKNCDKLSDYLLQKVCDDCGYELIRADRIKDNDKIDETIINTIKSSDIIICNITEINPNVFYELGYSVAIGKEVIQIADKSVSDIPFDRQSDRTYYYTFDVEEAAAFQNDIKKVIERIEQSEKLKESIHENEIENNDDSYNKSYSAILSFLERLDKSYRIIEDLARNNNHLLTSISKTSIAQNTFNNALTITTQKHFVEELVKNPQTIIEIAKAMQNKQIDSDSTS